MVDDLLKVGCMIWFNLDEPEQIMQELMKAEVYMANATIFATRDELTQVNWAYAAVVKLTDAKLRLIAKGRDRTF